MVALADTRGWEVSSGVAVVFTMATVVGLVGLAASRRIPASLNPR